MEDDPGIAEVLDYALREAAHEVTCVTRGAEALAAAEQAECIVLDVGLPDMDGFEVCRRLRKSSNVPVLFLTSRSDEIDRVVGLEIGGDDYLTKPFSTRELLARIKAIMRRLHPETAAVSSPSGIVLDIGRHTVTREGRAVELSRLEFELLALLRKHPGQVFSRDRILDLAWPDGGSRDGSNGGCAREIAAQEAGRTGRHRDGAGVWLPAAGRDGMKKPSLAWRAVYFIQRLITWFAPPLHSLHWKIFAVLLIGLFLPALYFLWHVGKTIQYSHLYSTEQGMIDTAMVLADALGAEPALKGLPATRAIKQRLFKDVSPNLRIVICGADARVVTDTDGVLASGTLLEGGTSARRCKENMVHAGSAIRITTSCSTAVCPFSEAARSPWAITVIKSTADARRSRSCKTDSNSLQRRHCWPLPSRREPRIYFNVSDPRVIMDLAARGEPHRGREPTVKLETWTQSELGDLARALERMRRQRSKGRWPRKMASTLT